MPMQQLVMLNQKPQKAVASYSTLCFTFFELWCRSVVMEQEVKCLSELILRNTPGEKLGIKQRLGFGLMPLCV